MTEVLRAERAAITATPGQLWILIGFLEGEFSFETAQGHIKQQRNSKHHQQLKGDAK